MGLKEGDVLEAEFPGSVRAPGGHPVQAACKGARDALQSQQPTGEPASAGASPVTPGVGGGLSGGLAHSKTSASVTGQEAGAFSRSCLPRRRSRRDREAGCTSRHVRETQGQAATFTAQML